MDYKFESVDHNTADGGRLQMPLLIKGGELDNTDTLPLFSIFNFLSNEDPGNFMPLIAAAKLDPGVTIIIEGETVPGRTLVIDSDFARLVTLQGQAVAEVPRELFMEASDAAIEFNDR